MNIHLDSDVFDIVLNGTKTVEARVNDEKRRSLKVGDKLVFIRRPDDVDKIEAQVTKLKYYSNFEEMVKEYDISKLYIKGYTEKDFIELLKRFYSIEEQEKYGVVAIEFRKI